MGHKKRRTKPSLDNQAATPVESAATVSAGGSEKNGPSGGPPERPAERRAHRWLRRFFWACGIVVAVIVVLRIALWLSLPWILQRTMARYGLDARYERLNLSLLTGDAELWHLVLVSEDANAPLTDVEYCRAEISLVTLLTRHLVVHRIEIDGMDVNLTRGQDGTFPQLRTLLEILRERSERVESGDAQVVATAERPYEIDLTPPLRMDALRLQHVQVRFRDESVDPAFETRLDLNVRLSDLRSDKRQTRFQIILSSPPVLDQFVIEGTGSSERSDLVADVKVALQGLHPVAVEKYLADLGVAPDARRIALSWNGSVRIQGTPVVEANDVAVPLEPPLSAGEPATLPPPSTLQIRLESQNAVLTVDGREHFSLEHAAVDANVPVSGAIQVGKIRIHGGAFHAWRRATGALSAGGLQLLGRPQKRSMVDPNGASGGDLGDRAGPVAAEAGPSARGWVLDGAELRDVQLVLHDESVSPQVDLVLDLNEVTVESRPAPLQGLLLTARLGAPGIVKNLQVSGAIALSSSESRAALRVSGAGIRPDLLQPHLDSLGLQSLYQGGTFSCDVNAVFARRDTGSIGGYASIVDIRLQDAEELFGLKAIGVQGVKVDSNSGTIHIDQVEIAGQRMTITRDQTGYLTLLGFRLTDGPSSQGPQRLGRGGQPGQARGEDRDLAQDSPPVTPGRSTTRIEIGRLSWHDNSLTLIDRMVSPAKTIAVPDLGFELTDLVLGSDEGTASPASLKAWLRSPGTVERAELDGAVTLRRAGLSFDLALHGEGMALTEMTPYLRTLGAEFTVAKGDVRAKMNGEVAWEDGMVRCSATIRDGAVRDGDVELAGLDRMDVVQLDLADAGLRVERIALEQPRLTISRDRTGAISCVGVRTLLRSVAKPETSAEPTAGEPVRPVRIGHLDVKGATVRWSDLAVTPTVSQSMTADLVLSDFSLGVEAPPATVALTVEAPGMIQHAAISGQIQATPSRHGADLKIAAEGINTGPLRSYLPEGLRPAVENGRLNAKIVADLTPHSAGGHRASVNLADVDWRGNAVEQPLLRFGSAELAVERFDPNAQVVSIRELSLKGLEAIVERKTSGAISLLGFDVGASEPATVADSALSDAPSGVVDAATDESPGTGSVPESASRDQTVDIARRAVRLPFFSLDRLSVDAGTLTLRDATRPMAAPLVVADLQIVNSEGIRLLGDEPDLQPPVKIDIHGRIQPLTESLLVKLEMSPFAAQPRIFAEWDIAQIYGPGLTSVAPELGSTVDANSLREGRLSGSAQLTLHLERRNVTEFDFSRPLGLDVLLKAVSFRDAETGTVLAGFEELRAVVPRLDPNSRSVYVKEIGLVNPQGVISREADGWHVLGVTMKVLGGAGADANGPPATRPDDGNDVRIARPEDLREPDRSLDLRVDQLLVNGVDFRFADRTVDPPMYIPVKGLDVEVRGFATPGADSQRPVRFNVIATAGEVPLRGRRRDAASALETAPESDVAEASESSTAENRLLFQELSATGRLTLYPRRDGWVKVGLSGLELVNFEGVAKQNGMTLRDGIFDASIDMRFYQDQPFSTHAHLVFTDLSLTEPPDGFLMKLLALPVSLDTALFILRDANGAIRLPLSFKIDEDGLSRGQMTQAAVGAAATLIASAVAGSPFRVAGTVGNILGGEQQATSGAETCVVQYSAGVTSPSGTQTAELQAIAERLQQDPDLAATIRHQLGGGDIERVDGLVNPPPERARELLVRLRQNKADLLRDRNELASQTLVAHTAGSRQHALARTRRLQEIELQLGLMERALDDLLETMRPGSEYMARRRTRDACIAIGKARLATLAAILRVQEIPDGSKRITFVPPRFTEASDDAGGRITITLTKNKAR